MINGERIRQAREVRGLTQKDLANNAGIKQAAIAQFESGQSKPSQEVIQRIILQTGFPLSFFKMPTSIDLTAGSLLYRARAAMTSKESSKARQFARIIYEVAEKLREKINLPPLNIPILDTDPISAAKQTRSAFGLSPDTPIYNLIEVIERNGILVISLPEKINNQDAFSSWVYSDEKKPIIVISNSDSPIDRIRFSIAHELGHLVLHSQNLTGSYEDIEKQADIFASEFLMPETVLRKELSHPITLLKLSPLKQRWRVSIQSLIRKAYDLEIITQRQYRYLMQQISKYGWRKFEPCSSQIPIEKPRTIGQMAELIYGIPIDYKKIADDMNLTFGLIKEIIDAYALKGFNRSIEESQKENNATVLDFKRKA